MKASLTATAATRWLAVFLFAIAMARVESSVVFYLRTMIDRIEPYQPNPLPVFGGFAKAELIREAATLVMLATAGWLAGRNARARFGYFGLAVPVGDVARQMCWPPGKPSVPGDAAFLRRSLWQTACRP